MYAELFRLDGRAALVTGGSRGIGLACAEALGEAGARVAISARSREEGAKAVEYLKQKGIEAHDFAEAVDQYRQYGASVIGVSHDNIATLTKFSVSECRSKFPVAADEDSRIIRSYDASMPMHEAMANRVSYVIAPDGTILYEYTSLSPDKHVENTLGAVKAWVDAHPKQ